MLIMLGLLVSSTVIYAQQTDFLNLIGPYLGQKPPSTTPDKFALPTRS